MKPNTGAVLRVIGPIIEILSLMTLLRNRGQDVRIVGVPIEQICYVGVIAGFTLVIVGLFLSQFRRERDRTRL